MPQAQFDESQLTDSPFDESQLTDTPHPVDQGVALTARARRAGDMGQSQIDAERSAPESWLTKPLGGLVKGDTPKTPLSMSKRELSGGTNLPEGGAAGRIAGGVAAGLGETAEGLAAFTASPVGAVTTLGTMGIAAGTPLRALAGRITSGVFGVDMATKVPQLYRQLVGAAKQYQATGDEGPLAEAVTNAAASGYFLFQMGKHAALGEAKAKFDESALKDTPGPAEPPSGVGPVIDVEPVEPEEAPAPPKVKFYPVPTPEERAAQVLSSSAGRESVAKTAAERQAVALEHLKKNLVDVDWDEIPVPQDAQQITQFYPSDDEVAEVRRKAMYRNGAVELDELPETMKTKILAGAHIDHLLAQMSNMEETYGRPGFQYQDDNDLTLNYDRGSLDQSAMPKKRGETNWSIVKSPLPKELRRTGAWDTLPDVIARGRAGEPLTPKEQRYYNHVVAWAAGEGGVLDPATAQEYFERHNIGVELVPIREEIDAKAVEAQERAAIEAEAHGAHGDMDAADFDFRAPTGVSEVETTGRDGEKLNPLNPPEKDIADALDETLTRSTGGGDPQQIADLLGHVYGVKDKVQVTVDPAATVPRTEHVPGDLATGFPAVGSEVRMGNMTGRVLEVASTALKEEAPGQLARLAHVDFGGDPMVMDDPARPKWVNVSWLSDWTPESHFQITLPPDFRPHQVAHEIAYEVRKFSGTLTDELGHDDNLITARVLADMRARGFVDKLDNGLPKRAFATVAPNPLARSAGRTFDLDQPFPAALSRDAATPKLVNVFDPKGLLDPDNRAMHESINTELVKDGARFIQMHGGAAHGELFEKAFQDWHAQWLRGHGFDGEIWKDELGRHLTHLQEGEVYEEGGAQASETGEPKLGSPEESRIGSDHELLKGFVDKHGPLDLEGAPPIVPGGRGEPRGAHRVQPEPAPARPQLEDVEFSPEASERQRGLEEQDATRAADEKAAIQRRIDEQNARPKIDGKQIDFTSGEDGDFGQRGDQMDLAAQIPLITPFVKHDVIPFAQKAWIAAKELALGLGHALQPRLFVDDKHLDVVMQGLGVKNRALAQYRLSVAVRAARAAFDKMPAAEQIAFIDRQKLGQPHPTPELQAYGDLIQKLEDEWYGALDAEMKANGHSLPYLEHHLALIYKDPPAKVTAALAATMASLEQRINSKRPFEGSKDFGKQMVHRSLTDAMNAGLTPVSTNPFVLMELRLTDNMKFLSARKIFRGLRDDTGAVKFVPKGKEKQFTQARPGWTPISDRISQVYFPTDAGQVHAGTYFWEPNVARIMENYLSYDVIRQSQLGRGALALKNMTTAVELSLSPFHFFFVNMDALATGTSIGARQLARGEIRAGLKSIGENLLPTGFFGATGSPRHYVNDGGKLIRYLRDKDAFLASTDGKEFVAAHPNIEKLIDNMFSGGAILGMSEDYRLKSYNAIREHWGQGNVAGVALRAFPAGAQAMMQPLFDHYIPRMKLGAWMADYAEGLKDNVDQLANGSVSEASLARRSWDRIEDRFGELNFDNLFWNRGMKTALQLLFRSVTWKLGDVRAVGRAATTGMLGQARDFDTNVLQPILNMRQKNGTWQAPKGLKAPRLDADLTWIAGVAFQTAIYSTIAQAVFTAHHDGKPTMPWQSGTPLTDVLMPRTGGTDRNGRPSRILPISYARDWIAARMNPVAFIEHSLSAVTSRLFDAWHNKDFYGNWVYDPEAPLWKEVGQIVGHALIVPPISLQSLMEANKRGLTGPERAVSMMGGSLASPSYFATDFEEYMGRVLRRELEGRPGRSPEQAERADKTAEVTRAVREGKEIPSDAGEVIGTERLSKAARAGAVEGFEARVKRMSLKQLVDGWKYANPQEKQRLMPILMQKVGNARLGGKSVEEQQEILEALEAIRKEGGG